MKDIRITQHNGNCNQIDLPGGYAILFSYTTLVAVFVPGDGYYVTDQHYGPTTSKHINWFVGSGTRRSVPEEDLQRILSVTHKEA